MTDLTVEEIIKLLELEPLEFEGGYFRQTWKTEAGTAIYYLITPESWSSLHLLSIAEIWHFYAGDPLRQLQLHPDGTTDCIEFGGDLGAGRMPQIICPADVWQATRLAPGGNWALTGTTMAPPYTEQCIRFPVRGELERLYPNDTELIREFV